MVKEYSRRDALKIFGLGLAGISSGCTTAGLLNLNNVKGLENIPKGKDNSLDSEDLLRHYFTDEAFEKLKDIPIVEPYFTVKDNTGFSSEGCLSLPMTGRFERVIGFNKEVIESYGSPEAIIHEYVHFADRLGMINPKEFAEAYKKLKYGEEHSGLVSYIELYVLRYGLFDSIANFESVEDVKNTERIAYLGQRVAIGTEVPLYIHEQYKRILKISEEKVKSSSR